MDKLTTLKAELTGLNEKFDKQFEANQDTTETTKSMSALVSRIQAEKAIQEEDPVVNPELQTELETTKTELEAATVKAGELETEKADLLTQIEGLNTKVSELEASSNETDKAELETAKTEIESLKVENDKFKNFIDSRKQTEDFKSFQGGANQRQEDEQDEEEVPLTEEEKEAKWLAGIYKAYEDTGNAKFR